MGCCQGYLFTLGQGYFYLTLSAANMRKKEDNYGHVDKEMNKVTLENKTFFQNLFGVFDFFCSHLMVPDPTQENLYLFQKNSKTWRLSQKGREGVGIDTA